MRKLSTINRGLKYAKCRRCKEVFIDDLPVSGVVYCPNEGCPYALEMDYKPTEKEVLDGCIT